jgi:hypothetical protein
MKKSIVGKSVRIGAAESLPVHRKKWGITLKKLEYFAIEGNAVDLAIDML